MGSEWKKSTLGEVCRKSGGNIQTGPFGSQLHKSDYVADGIPSIMPVNIGDNRIDSSGIAMISETDARRLSRYLVRAGDIVYSRRGDVERRALVRKGQDGWLCGTGCLRVRFGDDSIDPLFASYQLGTPWAREWIVRHAIGATMPNLNTQILGELPLLVPPLPEQKAIAHILGSLDDKIELLRQTNATLEAMAQALYKSWFVDFDPVIDKALAAGNPIPEPLQKRAAQRRELGGARKPLPADVAGLFPDRFVLTEELGWVPEGWEVSSFGSLIESTIGGDWGNQEHDDRHDCRVAIIRGTDLANVRKGVVEMTPFRWVEGKKRKSRLLADGDLIIEVSGGSPTTPTGRSLYLTGSLLEMLGGYVVPASFCRKLRPKCAAMGLFGALHLDWIYSIGKMWQYQNQSTGISNFQTRTFLETESILIPMEARLLEEFYKSVRPFFDRQSLQQQGPLVDLRDTLLPKLLSGELRVPEAETLAERVL